jgi:hypothetical protein
MKLSRTMLVLAAAALASSMSLAEAQKGKGGGGAKPKPDKNAPSIIVPKPPEFTTGFVKEYNLASHQLTLNNGGVFRLAPLIANTPHPAGEKVKLRWTLQGIHRYVDQVEVAMPAPASSAAAVPASAPADTAAPAASPAAAPAAPTG